MEYADSIHGLSALQVLVSIDVCDSTHQICSSSVPFEAACFRLYILFDG